MQRTLRRGFKVLEMAWDIAARFHPLVVNYKEKKKLLVFQIILLHKQKKQWQISFCKWQSRDFKRKSEKKNSKNCKVSDRSIWWGKQGARIIEYSTEYSTFLKFVTSCLPLQKRKNYYWKWWKKCFTEEKKCQNLKECGKNSAWKKTKKIMLNRVCMLCAWGGY